MWLSPNGGPAQVGYGDVVPVNVGERIFGLFLALMGAFFLSFCVTAIANMVSAARDAHCGPWEGRREAMSAGMRAAAIQNAANRRVERHLHLAKVQGQRAKNAQCPRGSWRTGIIESSGCDRGTAQEGLADWARSSLGMPSLTRTVCRRFTLRVTRPKAPDEACLFAQMKKSRCWTAGRLRFCARARIKRCSTPGHVSLRPS